MAGRWSTCSRPTRPAGPGRGWGPEPRGPARGVRPLGGRERPHPVPRAGGRPARAGLRLARDPVHAHRVGQEPRGHRRDVLRAGPGSAHLLHGPHQGPGLGEVLRPVRPARAGAGRDDHRGRGREPRGAGHLRHRRDPGQPRTATGDGRRCGRGLHGRVPLLRRPGPRLGLADPAHRADERPVPAHVRDPGRHAPDPRRPHAPDRPARRDRCRGRAARSLDLLVRPDTHPRDDRGSSWRPIARPSTSCTPPRPSRWSEPRR